MQEKNGGMGFSFLFGFYIDILNGRVVGISAILFCLIVFLAEYVYKNISNENKVTMMLIVASSTLLFESLEYVFYIWKLGVTLELVSFAKILVIEILYNVIITIILYPLIQKGSNILYDIFKNKLSKVFVL